MQVGTARCAVFVGERSVMGWKWVATKRAFLRPLFHPAFRYGRGCHSAAPLPTALFEHEIIAYVHNNERLA